MIGTLEQPPIVIRSGAGRSLLLLFVSGAFVACGGWMVTYGTPQDVWAGWLDMAFFGLGVLVSLWRLVRPDTLTISSEGLQYTVLWRVIRVQWPDVTEFMPWRPTLFSTFVGMNFAASYQPQAGLRRFNTAALGIGGSLGSGWEVDSMSLCELLNQALAKWGPRR